MRLVKLTLLCLIAASLGLMWSNRSFVVDAYDQDPADDSLQIRLSGVDLAVTKTEIEPSPFLVPSAPDTRRVALVALTPPEPSEEPPEIELTDGEARLTGTVVGPEGPVEGTIVRIERHTSEGSAFFDVTTDADGVFEADKVPGGRFRVRAWVPGLMTTGGSDVRYVAGDEESEYELSMWGVDPTPSFELVHGGPQYYGQAGNVAVVFTQRFIDEEGILVTAPLAGGLVSVRTSAGVKVSSRSVRLTDEEGSAWFTLTCTGSHQSATITVRSGLVSKTFALPGCRPLPPPPPEPEPEPEPAPAPTTTTATTTTTTPTTNESSQPANGSNTTSGSGSNSTSNTGTEGGNNNG